MCVDVKPCVSTWLTWSNANAGEARHDGSVRAEMAVSQRTSGAQNNPLDAPSARGLSENRRFESVASRRS